MGEEMQIQKWRKKLQNEMYLSRVGQRAKKKCEEKKGTCCEWKYNIRNYFLGSGKI